MLKAGATEASTNTRSFDEFLSDLLLRLFRAGLRNSDTEVRNAVKRIAEYFRADFVELRQLNDARTAAVLLYWWSGGAGGEPRVEAPTDRLPFTITRLLENNDVRINRLTDLPADATGERTFMGEQEFHAAIWVPIIVGDEMFGFIVLAMKQEREWAAEQAAQIRLLGEAIATSHEGIQRHRHLEVRAQRTSAVLDNQTEFIVRWRPDGTRTWVNDSYCEFFQQSREAMIGTSFMPLVSPEDREKIRKKINAITPENPTQSDEHRVLLPTGLTGWQHWTDKGIFDESGKLIEIQSVGRDITREKNAMDALIASEERYRTLFESANDGIFVLEDERVVACNSKALQIFHRDHDDFIGKKPWQFSPKRQPDGSTAKELGRAILKDVYAGNARRFEWTHERPDGTPIYMEISLTTIDVEAGKMRVLASARDVTDAKLARMEIERRAEFQTRLSDLSARLLKASLEDTVQQIQIELGSIGVEYDLYSIAVWWFADPERKFAECDAYWVRSLDSNGTAKFSGRRTPLPWLSSQARTGQPVRIDDVDNLTEEASVDQRDLRAVGIKSLLSVPVQIDSEIAGCCVFADTKRREWNENLVQELRLIAEMMLGACARARATDAVMQSERDLAKSQEVASVGSYSYVYFDESEDFPPEGKLEVSKQFLKLYGFEREKPTLAGVISRIHPEDAERIRSSIDKAVHSGIRSVETYRVNRPDGTVIYLENKPHPIESESDNRSRLFGTVQDVTERVESRQKIEQALAEIRQLKDQLQAENLQLREEIRTAHGFDHIIGSSPKLRQALIAAEKVAPTEVPVLLLGETGTGKELVAQAIHDLSGRKDKVLVSVNCAALSKDLVESELFGHEKGAFTGAHSRRIGRFERANGGVLFLDEVGELSGELQAKLLRVLQTGDFERLGGSETLQVDVRLIAATNKNLQKAVDRGEFRADLYYRIASFPIELPPLRERREDIPVLAEHFVRKHAERMGKEVTSISARTIRHMTSRSWPGNIRELEGFIQRALIATSGAVLDYTEAVEDENIESQLVGGGIRTGETDLRSAERQHILKVLHRADWVIDGKRGAAAMMRVAPSTLRSKMKRLKIERPK